MNAWCLTRPIFSCATGITRIERGLYELTPEGALALARWSPRAITARHDSMSVEGEEQKGSHRFPVVTGGGGFGREGGGGPGGFVCWLKTSVRPKRSSHSPLIKTN